MERPLHSPPLLRPALWELEGAARAPRPAPRRRAGSAAAVPPLPTPSRATLEAHRGAGGNSGGVLRVAPISPARKNKTLCVKVPKKKAPAHRLCDEPAFFIRSAAPSNSGVGSAHWCLSVHHKLLLLARVALLRSCSGRILPGVQQLIDSLLKNDSRHISFTIRF